MLFSGARQRRSHAVAGKHYDASNDCGERQHRRRRRRPAQTHPAFPQGFESPWQFCIAELIVIEAHDRDAHAMLHFARTKVVEVRSPLLVFFEVLSDMLRQQNVACVATIHHSLRNVEPGAREIGLFVYIHNPAHRPAVDSHPKLQARMFLERATDLHRALRGRFWTRVKYQRHSVAGRNPDQTARSFGSLKLLGRADDLV